MATTARVDSRFLPRRTSPDSWSSVQQGEDPLSLCGLDARLGGFQETEGEPMRERHGRHIGIRLVQACCSGGVTAAAWPSRPHRRPRRRRDRTSSSSRPTTWRPPTSRGCRRRCPSFVTRVWRSEEFLSNHPLCCPGARADLHRAVRPEQRGPHQRWAVRRLEKPGRQEQPRRFLARPPRATGPPSWASTSTARPSAHRQRGWTIFNPYYRGVLRP